MSSAQGQGYEHFVIKPAASAEEAHEVWWPLMETLGWNRSPNDTKTHFISGGKDSFLLLYPKDTSKPEGCILACTFDNDTGWVGFFCMNEESRGKGWGGALFKAGLEHFTNMGATTVGLDGVAEQKKMYERRGFVETGIVRAMTRKSINEMPLEGEDTLREIDENKAELVDLKDIPLDIIADSDVAHTGLLRKGLWSKEALFSRPDVFGYAVLSTSPSSSASDLLAWILVRKCQQGYRLGPLYADSQELAEFVLRKAMRKTNGEGTIDAEGFMSNEAALGLFEAYGFEKLMDYHRMWIDGKAPKAQQEGGKGMTGMWAIFDAGEG